MGGGHGQKRGAREGGKILNPPPTAVTDLIPKVKHEIFQSSCHNKPIHMMYVKTVCLSNFCMAMIC